MTETVAILCGLLALLCLSCMGLAGMALWLVWRRWPKSPEDLAREWVRIACQAYCDGWEAKFPNVPFERMTEVMQEQIEAAAVDEAAKAHVERYEAAIRDQAARPKTVMTLGESPRQREPVDVHT